MRILSKGSATSKCRGLGNIGGGNIGNIAGIRRIDVNSYGLFRIACTPVERNEFRKQNGGANSPKETYGMILRCAEKELRNFNILLRLRLT